MEIVIDLLRDGLRYAGGLGQVFQGGVADGAGEDRIAWHMRIYGKACPTDDCGDVWNGDSRSKDSSWTTPRPDRLNLRERFFLERFLWAVAMLRGACAVGAVIALT